MNKIVLFFLILPLVLISCRSDQSEGDENDDQFQTSSQNIEQDKPQAEEPPQNQNNNEPERDPDVVYVDTEYLTFSKGVATFSDQIVGRTFKYHQFDLGGGEILDIHVSSTNENAMVVVLGPDGTRYIRQMFGGEGGDFKWNERFDEPGKYTVQVSLAGQAASAGERLNYKLVLTLKE